jgi:hypothetical protein
MGFRYAVVILCPTPIDLKEPIKVKKRYEHKSQGPAGSSTSTPALNSGPHFIDEYESHYGRQNCEQGCGGHNDLEYRPEPGVDHTQNLDYLPDYPVTKATGEKNSHIKTFVGLVHFTASLK